MIKRQADAGLLAIQKGQIVKYGDAPKLIVVDSSDQRLAQDLRSNRLVMIVFHWPECTHCLKLFGLLPSCVADLEGRVKVVRCEVPSCLSSSAYNKVRVTPTCLLVRNGIVVDRMEGELPQKELVSRINKAIRGK